MEDLHDSPESPSVSSNGHGETDNLLARALKAEAERDAAEADVHELTKALTGLTCSGSEFFVRRRERFIADIPACVAWVRRAREDDHRRAVDAMRARMVAEEALRRIADESVFNQLRYAEEDDADYFIRCFKSIKAVALAALSPKPPASPIARLSRELGASNASTGTPTNTSTHTGDQPL